MKSDSDPINSYAYQVRAVHRGFARILEASLAKHDITTGDWYLLRVLWEQDGLSQKELSTAVNVTESSIVTMLASLIKKGLLIKNKDKDDKRKIILTLTAKGKKLKTKLLPYAQEINALASNNIPKKDLDMFHRTLLKIKSNIKAELEK